MLSELPKIFGKNFLVGYFIPSALLTAGNFDLLSRFGLPIPLSLTQDKILTDATIFGFVSWFGAVLILVANLNILRLLEGYGSLNPARLCRGLEARRFAKLRAEIAGLDSELESCQSQGKEFPALSRIRRNTLTRQAAEHFPDEEIWLLPTSFGNAIRAFEVYPRVMYGLEGIQGWTRLLAVIPKDYLKILDDAKAQMDFWANLSFVGGLMGLEYASLAIYLRQLGAPWFMLVVFSLSAVAFSIARDAAIQWGELVKACFDVFLSDLRKKLNSPSLGDEAEERKLWTRFSQAIIFRLPM